MSNGLNLFVVNLDKRIDKTILKSEFQQFGSLLSVDIAKDEQGLSKGYGFVSFASMADGVRALTAMDGKTLMSKTIHVEAANKQDESRCNTDREKSMKWESNFDLTRYRDGSDSDSSSVLSSSTNNERQNTSAKDCVKERMRTLFETQQYADVTFFPKDSRAVSISAHKAILAVGSPLFQQMLFGESSKCAPGVKLEVQISNLSFTAFSNIVKYLYTDEVFFESDSLVVEILEGAIQFGVQSLVDRCKTYFDRIVLTEQNVCAKLQISIAKKVDNLKSRCLEYIERNTLPVLNSPDFLNCPPNTVRVICKLQSLNIRSEADLFQAVMHWVNSQSPQNKQILIEPLRKCIRFLTFTVAEFLAVLQNHSQVMSADDGLKIMLYLNKPPSVPDFQSLPSWCNKNVASRCAYDIRKGDASVVQNSSVGKVIIPLTSRTEIQHNIQALTCMLQMKCIEGRHEVTSIKLAFKKPLEASSIKILIKVRVTPSQFTIYETLNIVWSEEVTVPFKKPVFARRGDLVDIEVEALDIKSYEFLQYDDKRDLPTNSHFVCSIGSKPKFGKLFFIKEVEYGPQRSLDQWRRQRGLKK